MIFWNGFELRPEIATILQSNFKILIADHYCMYNMIGVLLICVHVLSWIIFFHFSTAAYK